MIRFNAQGNLISCADNIQFVSINVLPFKSSSQRSLLLHLYGLDSISVNFRELLSGSTIRHCCKTTVHWNQRSCRNSLSLWLWVNCASSKSVVSLSAASGREIAHCNFKLAQLLFTPQHCSLVDHLSWCSWFVCRSVIHHFCLWVSVVPQVQCRTLFRISSQPLSFKV